MSSSESSKNHLDMNGNMIDRLYIEDMLIQSAWPGVDPDRFPPFYVKRSDFRKMDNFLKITVNFPSLNFETWPISCPKNSKAQGMAL